MNSNVDPNKIIQMIQSGQNPQQLVLSYLEGQMKGTPMGDNLLSLARQGRTNDIDKIARNIYAQRGGKNYEQEFNAFKKKLGV